MDSQEGTNLIYFERLKDSKDKIKILKKEVWKLIRQNS